MDNITVQPHCSDGNYRRIVHAINCKNPYHRQWFLSNFAADSHSCKIMKKQVFAIALSFAAMTASAVNDTLSLAGMWRFQLDPMGFGKTPGSELYLSKLPETIMLPGSTDEGGKGIKNEAAYVDRLSRKFEYCGPAWYQREIVIPDSWSGRHVELELERCHWETTVYLDGRETGSDERLSTPNRFLLADLTPGVHTLTICVDNSLKYPMDQWTHGTSEYTQTNWNGITGAMRLIARPQLNISRLNIYPDIDNNKVKVRAELSRSTQSGSLSLAINDPDGRLVSGKTVDVIMPADSLGVEVEMPLSSPAKLWDEFTPQLYTLSATLSTPDGDEVTSRRFGMRKVEQGKHHVRVNGHDIHLRGVLDCAVFPLTGYPSTDKADWLRIMRTIKSYGMNHIRFHSWCPPEAAFDAADELGLYLQVELPMWIKDVGQYPARRDFFEKEMFAILDEYGNHPSFVLYCNGNENEGDFAVLEDLIVKGRNHDPRHLYSASTARTHVAADQFYASHVSPKGWITVYEGRPSTDWDVNANSDIDVPVIAHETGQRCMYPGFSEIEKYTGVLQPRNFQTFRERLTRNGMLHQVEDFLRASGAHTVLQYKEVNEALLRSDKSGGFQLLGLQDFPGQGSAFVGLLDAFWESKGLVTPEKFRESCDPVVLLARMPRRVYASTDTFTARIDLYNFGAAPISKGAVKWHLDNPAGEPIASGSLRHGAIARSRVDSIGRLAVSLSSVTVPGKYILHASLPGGIHNEWNIWVYPTHNDEPAITPVTTWAEAKRRLDNGENVLLIPDSITGRRTHFASHFWNPIMFNWDPMIVGTLIDAGNGAFNSFPTDSYADWQWTDILNHSTAIVLTQLRNLTPVIQSIDTYEENRKLGIAFEARVGNGNLFVLCVDPTTRIASRPATQQLIRSVSRYVASPEFAPSVQLTPLQIESVLTTPACEERGGEASEATRQLLNQ